MSRAARGSNDVDAVSLGDPAHKSIVGGVASDGRGGRVLGSEVIVDERNTPRILGYECEVCGKPATSISREQYLHYDADVGGFVPSTCSSPVMFKVRKTQAWCDEHVGFESVRKLNLTSDGKWKGRLPR